MQSPWLGITTAIAATISTMTVVAVYGGHTIVSKSTNPMPAGIVMVLLTVVVVTMVWKLG
jgi:hypothetical protein